MEKEWNNDKEITTYKWLASSHHRGGPVKDHTQIEAIVLIQDGNSSGSYVRVVSWVKGDEQRHFQIYRDLNRNTGFYFATSVYDMQVGDVVTNEKSGLAYTVTHKPDGGCAYRVLEPK